MQISELKQARQLATDITMSGAKLYELLAMEVDLRELRLAAVARPLEMAQIEQGMKNKVVTLEVGLTAEPELVTLQILSKLPPLTELF